MNELIRGYLEELAGDRSRDTEFDRLRELSGLSGGRRAGWKFDRNEIHDRS